MNKAIIAHEVDGLKGRVLVDGFRHQKPIIEAYFLTHFHGDHYDGLSESFEGPGLIHCTSISARLVVQQLGVKSEFVRSYKYGETAKVCGASITFLDANHCPGAALLLFELPCGTVHLHTGDMRYSPRMKEYPALKLARGKIDKVYLDTTYCHPKHTFRPQEDSIALIADSVAAAVQGKLHAAETDPVPPNKDSPDFGPTLDKFDGKLRWPCLVMLSAYKIGKERVLLEVAKRSGCKIFVDENKIEVLKCLEMPPEEMALFTTDMAETPVHVCRMGFAGELWPFFRPNFTNLQRYVSERRIEVGACHAFLPTGWADGSNYNKRNALQRRGAYAVQCVPYSEHSNFTELMDFVGFLKPKRVIPTVFSDDKHFRAIVARFSQKVDNIANKRAFVSLLSRPAAPAPDSPTPAAREREVKAEAEETVLAGGEEEAAAPIEVPSDREEEAESDRGGGGGEGVEMEPSESTKGSERSGGGGEGGAGGGRHGTARRGEGGEARGGHGGDHRGEGRRSVLRSGSDRVEGGRRGAKRRCVEAAVEVVELSSDGEEAEAAAAAPRPRPVGCNARAASQGRHGGGARGRQVRPGVVKGGGLRGECGGGAAGREASGGGGGAEGAESSASARGGQTSLRSFFTPAGKARAAHKGDPREASNGAGPGMGSK